MKNSDQKHISRRGFLKTAAAVSTALAISPTLEKTQAAQRIVRYSTPDITRKTDNIFHRTLSSGKAAFKVSALGFGVMGMTYNRSQHPDKKQCIRLLHEAVDRGVTLFDTAIIYGPLSNEINAEQQRQVQ